MNAVEDARRMYLSLGASLGEFLWFAGGADRPLGKTVRFSESAIAVFQRARQRGPVVLATAHMSNWELGAMRLAEEAPLAVVVHPFSNRSLADYVERVRRGRGVESIPPEGALSNSLKALSEGRVVAVLLDQVPRRSSHGFRDSFLGVRAWIEKSAALLASRSGATLLVAVVLPGRNAHVLRVLDEIVPNAADEQWVRTATLRASRAIESAIREEPSAWMWLHRRWREPLESSTRVG